MLPERDDAEECNFLYAELLTPAQKKAMDRDMASPRWDLDPPMREEFLSPVPYILAMARYADRLIAAGRKPGVR